MCLQDVAGLAHFVVHRLCVYWSAGQRNLEDILYAAACSEMAPSGSGGNKTFSTLADAQEFSLSSGGGVSSTNRPKEAFFGPTSGLGASMGAENPSMLTRVNGGAVRSAGGSFLQALLHEISNRIDVVVCVQGLCEGISVESLTEDSGVADLCARIVEPFCKRFEAAVVAGTVPIVLKHTVKALVKCDVPPIKPLDFIADCVLPHILNAILQKNKELEYTVGAAYLADDQVLTVLERVRDLVNLCFNQDMARHLKICLSDQAALSRSKWFMERYVLLLPFRLCFCSFTLVPCTVFCELYSFAIFFN
jgi:hypothetical protein